MTPLPLYAKVDRSRIVQRQVCPMSRYLGYDFNATGITRVHTGSALAFGIAMHAGLERILRAAASDTAVDETDLFAAIQTDVVVPYSEQVKAAVLAETKDAAQAMHKSTEQAWLLSMLLYGWYKQRLPRILAEYTIEAVEEEFTASLSDDLRLMLRIDVVLRHRVNGLLYILDFKSLGNVTDDWMVKQEHSAQTSLYIYALEQHRDEYVAGIMYEGLAKGTSRKDTNEKSPWFGHTLQTTPLCYVYTNDEEVRHEYTKAKGWRKVPAWQLVPDAATHYATLSMLYEGDLPQFCVVPPVRPTQQALERTVRQTIYAEREYYNKLAQVNGALNMGQQERADELSSTLFELNYSACYKYGKEHACQFAPICHGGCSPTDETQFVARTPHHAGEFEDGE